MQLFQHHVSLTAALMERRAHVRQTFGPRYQEIVWPFRAQIRQKMQECTLDIANATSSIVSANKSNPVFVSMISAAFVEECEAQVQI